MIPPWLWCWLLVKHAARHGIKQHSRHRIGRRIKRGAGALVSKPAAVVWACAAVGIIGWLAWPEQPVSAGVFPTRKPLSTGAGIPMLAPEFTAPGMFAFAPVPDFTTVPQPPLEIPPEQPPRVPEPASLALLAVPLAITAILMRRRT